MSRHAPRQELARQFGATDIVTERGDEGVARLKELTNGLGAHSVIEAVGTQESMMQAIRSTRPGGHVGFVGVAHDVALPGHERFGPGVHARRCAPSWRARQRRPRPVITISRVESGMEQLDRLERGHVTVEVVE